MHVLRATQAQFEATVSFAGLHQVLYPLLGSVAELARPWKVALEAAFGMTRTPPSDRQSRHRQVVDAGGGHADRVFPYLFAVRLPAALPALARRVGDQRRSSGARRGRAGPSATSTAAEPGEGGARWLHTSGTERAEPEPRSVDTGSGLPGVGPGWPTRWGGSDSTMTVLVAFGANLLVAVAKSVAAVITGSASLAAEAAHSWADTGNELFLVVANRRATRPPDQAHPLGHGREAYVWSLFAAFGLFAAGGAVSIAHGVNELRAPTPADDFLVGYLVLAISFVLEGTSLLRSVRQAGSEARALHRDLIEHVAATSDPTLRAVFAEDVAALIGLVLAAAGLGARQLSGSAVPDAVGSILIGLLLAVVAVQLINRNRRFLVGEEADPRLRVAVLQALLDMPEVARVTYLRLEVVGPRMIAVTGAVDLTGDDVESHLAVRLRGAGGADQHLARGGRRRAQPLRPGRAVAAPVRPTRYRPAS